MSNAHVAFMELPILMSTSNQALCVSFLHSCGVILLHDLLIFPLSHDDKVLEVGFWRISTKWVRNQKQLYTVLYQCTLGVLYFSHSLACVHSFCLCINIVSKPAAYFSELH